LKGYARRRFAKELRDYQHPPEIHYSLFRRASSGRAGQQVFRSLIQVNFYRSARD
jgi:hypothetical protein